MIYLVFSTALYTLFFFLLPEAWFVYPGLVLITTLYMQWCEPEYKQLSKQGKRLATCI